MLKQPRADEVIGSWIDVAGTNHGTEQFRVSLAAFEAIVAGHAPSIEEVAAPTGMSVDDLNPIIASMIAGGRLTLDETGESITGAGGLSLVESRHELTMHGRQYSVWCALDAVGIPAGLGVDATVHSKVSDSGEPLEIAISAGKLERMRPSGLVISLIPPTLAESLHDCCCSEIGFYSASENVPPPAVSVTVKQAMDLGRRLWRDGVPL